MKFYFLTLPILIWGFFCVDGALSDHLCAEMSNQRWGISIKEPVENDEEEADDVEGKEADLKNNQKINRDDINKHDRKENQDNAESKENNVVGTKNQPDKNKRMKKKITGERSSEAITPGKKNDIGEKQPGENTKIQKEKKALIKWKNESQKTQCNAYLASLKDAFLKARYYSIQGVPCDTAENARSFMTIINNCKRDCPEGFLKKHGYTSQIIRNLSWLEKLGSERCPDLKSNLPPQGNRLRIPQGRQTNTDKHRHQEKEGE